MTSWPLPRGAGTAGMVAWLISSSELYSGGMGGGTSFEAFAANSSGDLARKLWVGQAQASPKAQMVLPAMLSATFFRTEGSRATPPPASRRSVTFFIQSEPSRHGVHWPHDSWA